jgi:hypothetical protein
MGFGEKMLLIKRNILIVGFVLLLSGGISAHEPIYGNGPHVLFKGGFAPGITLQSGLGFIETEYNLEYGLTTNFTIGADLFFGNEIRSYNYNGIKIKGKYRFYTKFKRGSMLQFSALGGYKLSDGGKQPDVLNFGLAAGREAIDWYWFASAVYAGKITNEPLKPGDQINYDLTLGYRVTKLSYYKPDLVIFLEFIGKRLFSSKFDGAKIDLSGGNSWAVAPTLMFTYRNYAIRTGVEIGIDESGYIKRPKTNFRLSIEMHI